ncbi:hypothetical protein UC35_07920 [Ramlibacter tataouinensis]|uniref:Lipoprotein n=1 Tax=Ramlibacter tataouinensis TaxID=94132 RepID=A0A127JZD1_9BURK|nr:hypothetical protein UC35_07920 [Ramlibacter tataouinensis]
MGRAARALFAAASLLALAGCAIAPMGTPIPSVDNIGKARAAGIPPLALGQFALAPGKPPGLDQSISIRTNTVHSPFGSSFSAYLKESLAADLRAAGLLDPASPLVLAGELTDSRIEVPVGTASGTVAARLTLTRSGTQLYAKELRAQASWQAPFVGVEAVPMAVNHYQELYRQLTRTLLEDPEFQAAVRR